jgi:hypothetical protein
VTADLPLVSNSNEQVEATILTFPFISDADAFDHESRETMGRWKFKAKRAGYFFQADAMTGDWVTVDPTGSQWAAIDHRNSSGQPVFRIFRRRGRWHLACPSGEGTRQFPTIHAALQSVHQTDSQGLSSIR